MYRLVCSQCDALGRPWPACLDPTHRRERLQMFADAHKGHWPDHEPVVVETIERPTLF